MAYSVSEEKKKEWKEKAIENQKKAGELIMSVGQSYVDDPDKIAEVMQFASKFYKYSINNTMLIFAQNPHACFVQSFEKWKEMDSHVMKNEHGMKIWVPVTTTILHTLDGDAVPLSEATKEQKEDYHNGLIEGEKKVTFKLGTVFDIGQTDYPKDKYPELFSVGFSSKEHELVVDGLISFCRALGCTVATESLSSITSRGYYNPDKNKIVINSLLEDTQRLSTLSHEVGHMLEEHCKDDGKSRLQKEFEADCLSVLIQSHYGIELTDSRKSHLSEHYTKFETELELENPGIGTDEKIRHIEGVMNSAVSVFRHYAEQMDEFVQNEIDNRPVALNTNNNPIMSFGFEVDECQEFPVMGETYGGLKTASEAMEVFGNIPESRKSLVPGISLVGTIQSGERMEVIPICTGNLIDLDMLECYPTLRENPEADRMVKELVDLSRQKGFETYGNYSFMHVDNANATARHRRSR